jgi:hypothetical protein
VLRELADLREEASRLAERLARLRLRDTLGLPAEEGLRDILKDHRLASSSDGLAQARETLQEALEEDPRRAGRVSRLTALRDFLARVRAIDLEPGAAQELFELPRRNLVKPPGDAGLHGALPPVLVARELPFERDRDKRAELETALADAAQEFDGLRGAVFEAQQAAQREAGLGRADTSLCDAALDATDALAHDLGAWLLERNTNAKGGFARHDVLHLLHAPRCAPAFPRGELLRTVRRWAEMLRFDPSAGKAVRIDEDDRPFKRAGAFALPVDAPFEAMLSLLPAEGPRVLGQLLWAVGEAQLWVGPPADAPPEDLWLGDAAVRVACGALLEGLLRDPQFLRRCAKTELSRDDERAMAIAGVFDLRICAVRAMTAAQAHELGPGARTAQVHRELYARATTAELPLGLALEGLDAFPSALDELRGRALASAMRGFLRERYDEDWWRNPRALPPLQSVWSRGGRTTAEELWAEISTPPGIAALQSELVEACR